MASSDEIGLETDRDRGILSGPDRKWLLMDKDEYVEEHSRQYWGQRRDAVINRVRQALLDFRLLYQHLDHDLHKEMFYQDDDGRVSGDLDVVVEQEPAIQDTFAFLMAGVGVRLQDEVRPDRDSNFEHQGLWIALTEAFRDIGVRQGVLINKIEPPVFHGRVAPGLETIIERAEAGRELSGGEIELLLHSDRVDNDVIFQAVSEAVESEEE